MATETENVAEAEPRELLAVTVQSAAGTSLSGAVQEIAPVAGSMPAQAGAPERAKLSSPPAPSLSVFLPFSPLPLRQDFMGGTFTISNGGVFGSLMGTPIINPPQSAILGMHAIKNRPMAMPDGSVEVRPMMYLALTYDHRMIDGREAVTFLKSVATKIEDPGRFLLGL